MLVNLSYNTNSLNINNNLIYSMCTKKLYMLLVDNTIWRIFKHKILILVGVNTYNHSTQTHYIRQILSLNIIKNCCSVFSEIKRSCVENEVMKQGETNFILFSYIVWPRKSNKKDILHKHMNDDITSVTDINACQY